MENGLKKYHPVTNLIFFASVIVFGMILRHPLTLGVCFVAAFVWYIRLCGKAAVKSVCTFLLPMLILVTVLNGLFARYGRTELFYLFGRKAITLESLVFGFALGLTTVTVIIWFFCFNEVVESDKLMFLFGRIFPSAGLVIIMALRFVPMYRKRIDIISQAQKGLCADGDSNDKIKAGGKIISVLFTWSLENSVETSYSMRARGYGLKSRKSYARYKFRTKDTILSAVMLVLDVVLIAGCVSKTVYCSYNPYISIPQFSVFGAVIIISFAVLCFLPLIIELREDIKWNRLKSKI